MYPDQSSALVMIDMQMGFLQPASSLCIRMAAATVPACAAVIRAAHQRGITMVYAIRSYREDGTDVELTRKARWEAGGKPISPTAQGDLSEAMPAEFERRPEDIVIIKPRFSAFFQTSLDLQLRRRGISHLYLAGTTTPNCIRTTCYDGLSLDYAITLITDCCSSNTPEIQAANLADMQNIGAETITAAQFVEAR